MLGSIMVIVTEMPVGAAPRPEWFTTAPTCEPFALVHTSLIVAAEGVVSRVVSALLPGAATLVTRPLTVVTLANIEVQSLA